MFNIKDYYSLREKIVDENLNLVGVVLNDKEKIADEILSELKIEFNNLCGGNIPYDIPTIGDDRIADSKLYDFCKRLPKGSDLHVHGTALLPCEKLIDFIVDEDRLLINVDTYVLTYEKGERNFPLKEAFDKGLIHRNNLIVRWTTLGFDETKSAWNNFENMFSYHTAIDENYDVLRRYYVFAFKYYLSVNIEHVEIHVLLSKKQEETNKIINTIKDAYFEVRKDNPEFSVLIIGTSMKLFETMEETESILNCVLDAHENIRDDFDPDNVHDFVIGIDLVNEEDSSRPLKEYAPLLIEIKSKHPDFEYYLHCGESIDSNNDNLIDAFLLKAERVGHGTNLYRYPDLLKAYCDNEICLESCLISNRALDYVKDLRLHPSAEYLKRGVTIALCSDDPVYFEKETLVDDFFAAIVCWNLGIAEIKHLCINSIRYSGLDKKSKQTLLLDWNKKWNSFIDNMKG